MGKGLAKGFLSKKYKELLQVSYNNKSVCKIWINEKKIWIKMCEQSKSIKNNWILLIFREMKMCKDLYSFFLFYFWRLTLIEKADL